MDNYGHFHVILHLNYVNCGSYLRAATIEDKPPISAAIYNLRAGTNCDFKVIKFEI